MLRLALICALMLIGTVDQGVAQTPDRFAFVVGNHSYERRSDGRIARNSLFNLKTPGRDAKRYVSVLSNLGWTVLNEKTANLTSAGLLDELRKAANQVGSGSEVMFVFNGHGFSEKGDNYLVGVFDDGKKYGTVGEMINGSVKLSDIVKILSSRNPKRIIIVVNACSNQPLHSDISLSPVKPDFDTSVDEVLVLYSSSPKGIAYDVRDNFEGEDKEILSVFSRAFIPLLSEDRPLLSLFAKARIEVEAMSQTADKPRNMTGRQALQIPHVLFDSINGRFTVANVARTSVNVAPGAHWRIDPQACRANDAYLDEALALRDDAAGLAGADKDVVLACILAGARAALGIEKIGYNEALDGVSVLQSSPGKTFVSGDVIKRLTIKHAGSRAIKVDFDSVQTFHDTLARTYRKAAKRKSLLFSRLKDDDRKEEFASLP